MPDYLFDPNGNRKYLTEAEKTAFREAAEDEQREVRTFCLLLHYSGCRISEALAVSAARIDLSNQTVTFETLKKRKKGVFERCPYPRNLWTCSTWCMVYASCKRKTVARR